MKCDGKTISIAYRSKTYFKRNPGLNDSALTAVWLGMTNTTMREWINRTADAWDAVDLARAQATHTLCQRRECTAEVQTLIANDDTFTLVCYEHENEARKFIASLERAQTHPAAPAPHTRRPRTAHTTPTRAPASSTPRG